MEAFDYGQRIDKMSIEQFCYASFDDMRVAAFEGKLDEWWSEFWKSCAAKIALSCRI